MKRAVLSLEGSPDLLIATQPIIGRTKKFIRFLRHASPSIEQELMETTSSDGKSVLQMHVDRRFDQASVQRIATVKIIKFDKLLRTI